MTEVRLAPEFEEALQARLKTPEGKEAMERLIGLIAEAAAKAMPPELLDALDRPEGDRKEQQEVAPRLTLPRTGA